MDQLVGSLLSRTPNGQRPGEYFMYVLFDVRHPITNNRAPSDNSLVYVIKSTRVPQHSVLTV